MENENLQRMPTDQGSQFRIAFQRIGNWHCLKDWQVDQHDDQIFSPALPEVVGGIHIGKRIDVTNPATRQPVHERIPGVLKRVRC